LEAGGQIDAVAVTVIILNDDVAQVDTNAHVNAPLIGNNSIASKHYKLQIGGAVYSVNDTVKLCKKAVPHQFKNAPFVSCDLWFKDLFTVGTDSFECIYLVGTH
jgi:hypothetical protein